MNDPGTEAEHLSEMYDDVDYETIREWRLEEEEWRKAHKDIYVERYKKARKAPVGSKIKCPICGKVITKKSYQHCFCSNKGKSNCKDKYWNYTDDKRYKRCRHYGK